MKTEYLKSFSNEISKIAWMGAAALNAAFSVPTILGAKKSANTAMNNLGKKTMPSQLTPLSNVQMGSQFGGPVPYGM